MLIIVAPQIPASPLWDIYASTPTKNGLSGASYPPTIAREINCAENYRHIYTTKSFLLLGAILLRKGNSSQKTSEWKTKKKLAIWKFCIIMPFLYSAKFNIQSLEMFIFFPNFRILKSDWLIFIYAHSILRVWEISHLFLLTTVEKLHELHNFSNSYKHIQNWRRSSCKDKKQLSRKVQQGPLSAENEIKLKW